MTRGGKQVTKNKWLVTCDLWLVFLQVTSQVKFGDSENTSDLFFQLSSIFAFDLIFDQIFEFWVRCLPDFQFSVKIFGQNFVFWSKISKFESNFSIFLLIFEISVKFLLQLNKSLVFLKTSQKQVKSQVKSSLKNKNWTSHKSSQGPKTDLFPGPDHRSFSWDEDFDS